MALKTKIKLKVDHDYRQLKLASMTGTGVNGYGANQDLAGYRLLANGGNGFNGGLFKVTSPSGTITTIPINAYNVYDAAMKYGEFISSIINLQLGYSFDEQLEDGFWKVEYTEFFHNNSSTYINWTQYQPYFTFNLPDYMSFKNSNYIYLDTSIGVDNFTASKLYPITSIVTGSPNKLNTTTISQNSQSNYTNYLIGYSSTKYIPVSRSIKECLDNKIADLVECECDEVDAELVNKYLLYDAMFVNCEIDNINKAKQIFELLSKYCDDNCGCD